MIDINRTIPYVSKCLTFMAVLMSVSTTAYADDNCSDILVNGVFNTNSSTSNYSEQEQVDDYLESMTYNQYKSDVSDGLNFTLLNVGLQNNFSSQQFDQWQQNLKQHNTSSLNESSVNSFLQTEASPAIIAAWQACEHKFGINTSYDIDPSNPGTFTFEADYHQLTPTSLPKITSFTVSGGQVVPPNPFIVGAQVPLGGMTVTIQRMKVNQPVAEYPGVSIALNTDIESVSKQVPAYSIAGSNPPLNVQIFHGTSGPPTAYPEASVSVTKGFKLIGGGAKVITSGQGNMLTASYPSDSRTWTAKAKDQDVSSPGVVEVWAFGLFDPQDLWDVRIVTKDSDPSERPEVQLNVPTGYAMTGGGGYARWTKAGQLLTSSYPSSSTSWDVRSKDHMSPESAVLSGYLIAIKARNMAPPPQVTVVTSTSQVAPHPTAEVTMTSGFTMTSGGAFDQWSSQGNLLTGIFPLGPGTFAASGKDHEVPDPASIVVYGVGLNATTAGQINAGSENQQDAASDLGSANFGSNSFSTQSLRNQKIRVNGRLTSSFVRLLVESRGKHFRANGN